jgi:hypothetical protein
VLPAPAVGLKHFNGQWRALTSIAIVIDVDKVGTRWRRPIRRVTRCGKIIFIVGNIRALGSAQKHALKPAVAQAKP